MVISPILQRILLVSILSCAILLSGAYPAVAGDPLIREERKLTLEKVTETWRLEWSHPPKEVCGPDDPDWITCPCMGFAFAQAGKLVLVREIPPGKEMPGRKDIPGKKEERLELGPFFNHEEYDSPGDPGQAVLHRWNIRENDHEKIFKPGFAAEVRKRPRVRMVNFGDYDHDGRASEFRLQVGTLPCGKKMSIVVGITKKRGELHAFTSMARPDRPLVLQAWQWEKLREAKGPVRVVSWPCGDHGSEKEVELELKAENGVIQAIRREFECTGEGKRDKIITEESF